MEHIIKPSKNLLRGNFSKNGATLNTLFIKNCRHVIKEHELTDHIHKQRNQPKNTLQVQAISKGFTLPTLVHSVWASQPNTKHNMIGKGFMFQVCVHM